MILDGGDGDPAGDGAYEKASLGPAPHEGAVHVVAGSSGQISGGALNHPAMYRSLNSLGSLLLDVDRNQLDARFLDDGGMTQDAFRIIKGGPAQLALDLCPPAPRAGCRSAARARLVAYKGTTPDRDRVSFNWSRGEALLDELGDPRARTDHALCVYDASGVLIDMDVSSDPLRWAPLGTRGFVYRDGGGSADGATSLRLTSSTLGNARMSVRGKGTALPDPSLPAVFPVTAQLLNDDTGVCFTATFTSPTRTDATHLTARSP
jgi:hypothetical protein